jgi:hypothetical protein
MERRTLRTRLWRRYLDAAVPRTRTDAKKGLPGPFYDATVLFLFLAFGGLWLLT